MALEDPTLNALYTYTKVLSVALGYRDLLTQRHSERVESLSGDIGIRCGLSGNEIIVLKIAASFHDIGKIGIPYHILLKPAQFDEAEWREIKQHSEIGERILASTELEGSQQAARVIRHHHEHYNGSGYPDGLSGEKIPICARIISIADSYDAMAVSRPYHRAKKHSEVMDILREETGDKHDPQLMQVFCEIIERSDFRAADS